MEIRSSKKKNLRLAKRRRANVPLHPKPHWLDRGSVRTVFSIGEILGILAILVGLAWYIVEWSDRVEQRTVNLATLHEIEEAREERKQEAIARAWNLLTTPASGNSGKIEAMSFLIAQKVSLVDIDLSCETMGGDWFEDEESEEHVGCVRGTYLLGANLSDGNLEGAKLAGATLDIADFTSSTLRLVDFRGASLLQADFTDADITGADFRGADYSGAKFDGAWVDDLGPSSHPLGLEFVELEFCKLMPGQIGADMGKQSRVCESKYIE